MPEIDPLVALHFHVAEIDSNVRLVDLKDQLLRIAGLDLPPAEWTRTDFPLLFRSCTEDKA